MVAGEAIYVDECSACHGPDGNPYLFPSLAGSSNVRSADPISLIRVVIEGARSVATAGEPTGPGMLSFAWTLSDDQAAAVLTYVRSSWGASRCRRFAGRGPCAAFDGVEALETRRVQTTDQEQSIAARRWF
jgi:mono/diheme cytochrome c family protein